MLMLSDLIGELDVHTSFHLYFSFCVIHGTYYYWQRYYHVFCVLSVAVVWYIVFSVPSYLH